MGNFLGAFTGGTIVATVLDGLFKFLEPDVTINGEIGTKDYRDFYNSTNHELSHASHFTKVGSNYWSKYVSYIIQHGDYGSGQGSYHGICEVGEMWGHAMGDIQMSEEFNIARLGDFYNDSSYRVPYRFTHQGDNGWICPDPIWALITRGVLTKKQIFDCLTSDVDTVDKLINKLCVNKTVEVANAIRTAFAHNDVPVITGTVPSRLNVDARLSVPAATNMADGFTFTGWTVSPNSGYTTTSGLNNRNLTIKFTAAGIYTLAANFTLPNGSTYSPTKTIDLRPPTITSISIFPKVTQAAPGQTISFTAQGTNLENAAIQWEAVSGCIGASSGQGVSFTISAQNGARAATVRCRVAHGGGSYSAWKTGSITINGALPWVRSADIP